ncbi:MAG: hypothetical protein QOG64_2089, partial [Acidimicrobiaceae bacterium]|nr:hypothetical protein [Acidimicrobiaceae bacterium]
MRRGRSPVGTVRDWDCPVCRGHEAIECWPVAASGSEGGVDAASFRPSSETFGTPLATVVECMACGHRSVSSFPDPNAVEAAYADAADPVSVREEKGQVATASRDLESIERWVARGTMVDLGCWTGSFCVASSQRGWRAVGVEPSKWGSERARQRGASVIQAGLDEADLPPGQFDLVVLCDVLEHLADPGAALRRIRQLLRPGGVLFLTVPDAGSVLARVLGRRWWSVLPMHLQYFTRE